MTSTCDLKDWTTVSIGDVLAEEDGKQIRQGWSPQCHKEPSPSDDVWGVLKTTAIQPGRFLDEHNKALPSKLTPRPEIEVKPGDLLLTCAGPRVRCGVPCLIRNTRPRLMMSGKMYRFRPIAALDPEYLELHLLESQTQKRIDRHKTGISDSGLNLTHARFKTLPIHVAPLVEQRAIVAKIESLFSELDQGVAQLEAVQTQLGRYRQAVLKAAFEGRLTAAWREQRRREAEASGESLPTADDLLTRIRTEREAAHAARLAKWERAVAAWEAAGGKASGTKKPRKPAAPTDPPPLTPEELADLPDLPEGWVWCRLDMLSEVSGGLTKNAKRSALPLRLPYLRVANVYSGRLELDEVKDIGVTEAERDKTLLAADDLLFVEGNGSADQIGRVSRWSGVIDPCLHQNHLIRARPIVAAGSTYLVHWFLSPTGRERIMREASSTSGLHTLSISKVSALLAPVAPCDEQTEIVNEIDARLSVVDQVERTIAAALNQAEALRQSILKKAFGGRLLSEAELTAVRADPAYEPAGQLLARIRGDAAQRQKPAASKRSRSKPVAVSIPKGERFRQAACAAYAVKRLASQPTFGRVQQMKYLYLVPHVVEQESHIHAERQAAGPLDPAIHKIESLAKKQEWFTAEAKGKRTVYTPGAKIDKACAVAEGFFGPGKAKVDWLLDQFAKFDTERAELVATTFAVWNDMLIDCDEPSEAAIVAGVHGWHPEKVAKFPADRIGRCIKWLRDNDLVPTGTGPRTQVAEAGA